MRNFSTNQNVYLKWLCNSFLVYLFKTNEYLHDSFIPFRYTLFRKPQKYTFIVVNFFLSLLQLLCIIVFYDGIKVQNATHFWSDFASRASNTIIHIFCTNKLIDKEMDLVTQLMFILVMHTIMPPPYSSFVYM